MELCNDDDPNSAAAKLCDTTFSVGRVHAKYYAVSALFAVHSSTLDFLLRANKDQATPIKLSEVTPTCFEFLQHSSTR